MLAKRLSISESCLRNWMAQADADDGGSDSRLSTGEKKELVPRGTYGWPRVHAELTLGLGLPVNHKRVRWLMPEAGLQGLYRRCTAAAGPGRRPRTTWSTAGSPSRGRTGCG